MLLIKNAKVFTMAEKDYESGCILIDKGKIIKIAENIHKEDYMDVIEADGSWVFPGFIEAHSHIGLSEEDIGEVGQDINETSDPVTPEMRAIDGINPQDPAFAEAVRAGITTVMTGPGSANVIGGQFAVLKTHGICVDDMVILEPAAMKVAFGENPKRVYKGKGKMPITRMATAAILRNALNNAKNYRAKKLRAINNGELFDIDLKMEALIPVLEKKIPLKAHAHRADDILTAIRIAKEFDVNVTIDHCTDGILISDYIKDAGVSALVGPTMSFRTKQETKNKTFETPRILNEKGVRVAIITDHPVTPINYLPLCAGLAVKAGLNMKEAFRMITINAAEILGVDERIGSIEVGKDADLAIFDGNPMETMTNTLYTIIDGQIIYSKDMINLNR